MGLSASRATHFPDNIDTLYEAPDIHQITYSHNNSCRKGRSTLPKMVLERAGEFILSYFEEIKFIPKIIEPYAGNGVATNIIYKKLITKFPVIIKSTEFQDLIEYMNEDSYDVEFDINGVDTIKKYAKDGYDTLMMISPPPNEKTYHDYFTIREWEKVETSKYFIFIGELGASDGSAGLYEFMLKNNPIWKLECRKMLFKKPDEFSPGDFVEKELFIFSK